MAGTVSQIASVNAPSSLIAVAAGNGVADMLEVPGVGEADSIAPSASQASDFFSIKSRVLDGGGSGRVCKPVWLSARMKVMRKQSLSCPVSEQQGIALHLSNGITGEIAREPTGLILALERA
jgi:hypothetical protein